MDVVGVVLAVVPLMITALEKYDKTFERVRIFVHRYPHEARRVLNTLRVQQTRFENECCFLLHNVGYSGQAMIKDLGHEAWTNTELEERFKNQLNTCYEACSLSLSLINELLTGILKDTDSLWTLTQDLCTGQTQRVWKDNIKRFKQRSKLSFRKGHFDAEIAELRNHIDSLESLRKQTERIAITDDGWDKSIQTSSTEKWQSQVYRDTSIKIHDLLSSFWRCKRSHHHLANIALDAVENGNHTRKSETFRFDLAWSCPAQQALMGQPEKPLWVSIETPRKVEAHIVGNERSASTLRHKLQSTLKILKKSKSPPEEEAKLKGAAALAVRDLNRIPDLCSYLLKQSPIPVSADCVGFLQNSPTSKYFIYAKHGHTVKTNEVKSLEDALNAARSSPEGIPYPEKLTIAKLLSLALLRYYSTPWLRSTWGSRDIVFYGIKDFSEDPLNHPFLKSEVVKVDRTIANDLKVTRVNNDQTVMAHPRSPARDQTLFNLGVMLVELAYDSPLLNLQNPGDDQGDGHTLYWTAIRLGDKVGRRLGPKYADAVNICLHGGFGASCDLDDASVHKKYFDEVVKKLSKCADAVMI